jgi:hypothetical protein
MLSINRQLSWSFPPIVRTSFRHRVARPKSSGDLPTPRPRKDTDRETREAIIQGADKTYGADRDLVHGEGGAIDLPTKPRDLNHDG